MKTKNGYQELTMAEGKLICQLRNDLGREEAIRLLRQIADRLELLAEAERTCPR